MDIINIIAKAEEEWTVLTVGATATSGSTGAGGVGMLDVMLLAASPGSSFLGQIPAGAFVYSIITEILTPFDSGLITVGEQLASARFQEAADVDTGIAGAYQSFPNYKPISQGVDTYAFLTGSPSEGSAKVTILFFNGG